MLGKVGLLTGEETDRIVSGLEEILEEIRRGTFTPDPALEDVHMNIEARLTEKIGEAGAKLHTGRSRNDQVATTMRLYLRDRLADLESQVGVLIGVLADRAERDLPVVVPGYTHLQQAQPISMGHYWAAYAQAFLRDLRRLGLAREDLDECPLGAGALAGSTLPLDRALSAELLGFSRPTENSLDSIAQRDYQISCHEFAVRFCLHSSRLAEDLILYATTEFGFVRLPDAYCTGSSMMPQKKNPDVLELIRGKAALAVGRYVDLAVLLKGLPSTYDRDLQDDKRGLFESLDTVEAILSVLPGLLSGIEIDEKRAGKGLEDGLLLATDVAEYLVQKGIPFRRAHERVGRTVRYCVEGAIPLHRLTLPQWRELIPEVEEDLLPLLDPRVSVERRRTYGGTAFEEVLRQIGTIREALSSGRA
jgi:argininosuccinate lyase